MPRTTRTHIDNDSLRGAVHAPAHMTKTDFAKRLSDAMNGMNWNQAELARRAKVSKDSISAYIGARQLPTPMMLKRLAQALHVEPVSLLPNYVESAIADDETPAFELKVTSNAPAITWLRINRAVPTTVALKIAALLEEADARTSTADAR